MTESWVGPAEAVAAIVGAVATVAAVVVAVLAWKRSGRAQVTAAASKDAAERSATAAETSARHAATTDARDAARRHDERKPALSVQRDWLHPWDPLRLTITTAGPEALDDVVVRLIPDASYLQPVAQLEVDGQVVTELSAGRLDMVSPLTVTLSPAPGEHPKQVWPTVRVVATAWIGDEHWPLALDEPLRLPSPPWGQQSVFPI